MLTSKLVKMGANLVFEIEFSEDGSVWGINVYRLELHESPTAHEVAELAKALTVTAPADGKGTA